MKQYRSYVFIAFVCAVLGLFFKLALIGYSTLSYAFFGVAALSLFFMALKLLAPRFPKLTKTLNKLACYAIWLFLFALAVTEIMLFNEAKKVENRGADYAIVLGAGVNGTVPSLSLKARLDAALSYAEANPDTVLIVSGGQGNGETITEAECMYRWLTARGVAPERIVMEDRAANTQENIAFSRALILERDPDFRGKICLVTEGYHIARAKLFALRAGFLNVTAERAYTGYPVLTANYYLREAIAMWYYLIFA